MNELKVFENEEFGKIRTIMIENEPWFVAKDMAVALGYGSGKAPINAVAKHVDLEDKGVTEMMTPGGRQNVTIINESGVYALVFGSKLESAKRFKHWITHDVLPTIRKTGGYINSDELFIETYFEGSSEETKNILRLNLSKIRQLNEEKRQLQQTVSVQAQQISEMQPKVTYYDIVLNCKDLVAISVIAKDYGWSAKHMNQYLHEKGVQYKQGSIWLLYQKYASSGYTSTRTYTYQDWKEESHTDIRTYWTQKGRLFIYELMKSDGNLPLIEQEGAIKYEH
jgi:prophage antirepressor-like protein